MQTINKQDLGESLVAVLRAHERAKSAYVPEDNPFAGHTLDTMPAAGLLKAADKHPALNMAPKSDAGYDMEAARYAGLAKDKADKSAKRMAEARRRAERKVEFDKIADSPVMPSSERMAEAWEVVVPLLPIITKIARSKQQWASRFLGSVATDEVPNMALEKTVLVLAKSKHDLSVLKVAATELGEATRRTNQVPGDQLSEDERKERKQIAKARKWLMGMVNNRVMGAVVDVWTSTKNLRWDNIDIIATVMANISGVGEDPLTSRFKADRAPAFLGTKFQRPEGIDSALLATAINAAFTDRGLDPLVEFLLNDEHREASGPNGAVRWSEYAEHIFKLTPEGDWMWQTVVAATTGVRKDGTTWPMDRARKARGDAARAHVRNQFEFLPHLIVSLVDAFDQQAVGYTARSGLAYNSEGEAVTLMATARDTRINAVLASDFEAYLPEQEGPRKMLVPVLRYATVEEAVQAVIEELALLVTGNDLVASVVNA